MYTLILFYRMLNKVPKNTLKELLLIYSGPLKKKPIKRRRRQIKTKINKNNIDKNSIYDDE